MLRELHITNLAVIEDAVVELGPGLNCFTGETGAGKSLVLGAFELLLGLRGGKPADMLRGGADEGRVTGVFELGDVAMADAVADAADQSLAPGEPLLMTRKLFASGRSSVSINGQPASTSMAKRIGELLVDVHGQHDHQSLLRPANQLTLLDDYARSGDRRRAYREAHQRLRGLLEERAASVASSDLRRQQLDLYRFQADEIDQVSPRPGEYPPLAQRHRRLMSQARIARDTAAAIAALQEADGSVLERLHAVMAVLQPLVELDDQLSDAVEATRAGTLQLQEAAFDLNRYRNRLEADEAAVAEVEQRLNALNRLASKYGDRSRHDDPVDAVVAFRETLERELSSLESDESRLAELDAAIAGARRELAEAGRSLSAARAEAAAAIEPRVDAELADLGMAEARFRVELQPAEEGADGADGEAESLPPASGLERVEMLIRANPGEPAKPLRQVASGGELSRIMLALKTIAAQADRVSVLVFDEIDANIGGRLGSVIGRKLLGLARRPEAAAEAGRHQVLCITHLPQIAAFADRHLRIRKRVSGRGGLRRTSTTVEPLEGEARVDELAEMLAGGDATATTRRQAGELLESAAQFGWDRPTPSRRSRAGRRSTKKRRGASSDSE